MTTFADYSYWQVTAAQLASMGFSGVARYLSHDASKDLSVPERDNLRAADFDLFLVCESTANRAAQGFAAGVDDAHFYNQRADALGYPLFCTLAYAVDFDASPAQVQPYFDGVASVITGRLECPYGGVRVVDGVRYRAPLGWQTAAWSGGRVSKRAGLLQDRFRNTYDSNTVLVEDFGQWRAGTHPSPSPTPAFEEDDMAAIRIPAPRADSKTDPDHNGDVFECATLKLYGKGRVAVTCDEYPSTARGADVRIAKGHGVVKPPPQPNDFAGQVFETWIGNVPWEADFDEAAGDDEIAVTVYGVAAGAVTVTTGPPKS